MQDLRGKIFIKILQRNIKCLDNLNLGLLFSMVEQPTVGQDLLIIKVTRSNSDIPPSVGLLQTGNHPVAQRASVPVQGCTLPLHSIYFLHYRILFVTEGNSLVSQSHFFLLLLRTIINILFANSFSCKVSYSKPEHNNVFRSKFSRGLILV